MGYTHYWEGSEVDEQAVKEAENIIKSSGVTIKGWDGEEDPVVTVGEIRINGDASMDHDHETFHVGHGLNAGFEFCKTARKPYDRVVGAILIALFVRDEVTDLSSDGYYDEQEWQEAISLFEEAVRPLTDEEHEELKRILGLMPNR